MEPLHIIAAGDAEAEGKGAASLDGKMIDVPIVKRARYLLDMAESASLRD